jgi:hypothetical protein
MSAKVFSATEGALTSVLFALVCRKDGARHIPLHPVYHKHRRRWAGLHCIRVFNGHGYGSHTADRLRFSIIGNLTLLHTVSRREERRVTSYIIR